MAKAPAFQFYVKDWLCDPQLKMATHTTKGIWIDLLCFMWESPIRGMLTGTEDQIAKMIGSNNGDFKLFLNEAEELKFCDVTFSNNKVMIINRRMKRDENTRIKNNLRVQKHRNKEHSNENVMPPSSSSTPSSVIYTYKCEFFQVTEQGHLKYKTAYPNIDLMNQYQKMAAWLESNPSKRKTQSGYPRFINSWLSRASEKKPKETDNSFKQTKTAKDKFIENGELRYNPKKGVEMQ